MNLKRKNRICALAIIFIIFSNSIGSKAVELGNDKKIAEKNINYIAKIQKYINGEPYNNRDKSINIYAEPEMRTVKTYINHKFVSDAPIIEDRGNVAKIIVNGTEGWINKNTALSEYDMISIHLNDVVNPSYYFVQNGELKHYISNDIIGSGGSTIILGQAPTYLVAGTKYLSYDGTYFYSYKNIQDGFNVLLNDYKSGSRKNASNANNPYNNYYINLPFRSKTIYTESDINRFIDSKTSSNSKLRNCGHALKNAEEKFGVNALLILSIAINESNWGNSDLAQSKNNLFGIKAQDSNLDGATHFNSPSDSIYEFARNWISAGYSDPGDWRYNGGVLGNKNYGANVRYASDPFWAEKASMHAYAIDKFLSNNDKNLRDSNIYDIGIVKRNTPVINRAGTKLYDISTVAPRPFVVTQKSKVVLNNREYYEIYPEVINPITSTNFNGDYSWGDRGYILASDVSFISTSKGNEITKPQVSVIGGSDRYSTASLLSKESFNKADTVVIVNGLQMADGLASTPLGAYYKAPLLLTYKDEMPSATINEIKRLGAKNAIIVGGSGVVSNNVLQQLRQNGISSVIQLGGRDRYETSLEVAKYIDANCYDVDKVVLANGLAEADALSIAPISGRDSIPIMLVKKNEIPSSIFQWLKSESLDNGYVIGSTGVVENSILNNLNSITNTNISSNRLGGKDRYETNARILERFYGVNHSKVYVTKGLELIDALSSGPIASISGSPIILAGNDLSIEQKSVISRMKSTNVIQVGKGVSGLAIETLRVCLEYIN